MAVGGVFGPLLLLVLTLHAGDSFADSGCTHSVASGADSGRPAQTIYVDPETGELLSEPPLGAGPEVPMAGPPPVDTGPVVERIRPDGEIVADIGDRFVHELRVEIVDGKVVTCHAPAERAADEP